MSLNSQFLIFLLLLPISLFSQDYKDEFYVLPWAENGWKLYQVHEEGEVISAELKLKNPSAGEPHQFAGTSAYRVFIQRNVDQLVEWLAEDAKERYRKAKMTRIEQNTIDQYPWAIFMIECKNYDRTGKPQSILMHVVKGWEHTFVSYVAIESAKIPNKFKKQYEKLFSEGRVEFTDWESSLRLSGLTQKQD